ncbi:AIPR family protein [Candidatus Clostridium helianthi]|uniref:AIPR family protein n=1 Tax=Candidatus Clostridium helianthi TaxID=3381660 RepID=A0ABW8SCS7_9CLOT
MGILQINQIKDELHKRYDGKIDISDTVNANPEQKEDLFLTRALCCLAIESLSGNNRDEIGKSITDGSKDNGIDAIYFDQEEGKLYIAQSKFNKKGDSEPELGDIKKFIDGIKDLISCRFDKFNKKIQDREEEITEILDTKRNIKVVVILAYTAVNFADISREEFDKLIKEQNDSGDVWSFEKFNQTKFYGEIVKQSNESIYVPDIGLYEWGKKEHPKRAYYGQASALQLAKLWEQYGNALFSKNIRKLLSETEINTEIKNSLESDPQNFWYYNNGITIVCEKVKKSIKYGGDRSFGLFECFGISIVNGAQTVGTIGKYFKEKGSDECLEGVFIPVKLVSANKDQDEQAGDVDAKLISEITRANNRQNKIENRDFISLDVEQKRISQELKAKGITYNIARSFENIVDDQNFDLEEATVALSNCCDINASTLAHREPGLIWSDTGHSRYKRIFNPSVNGYYVWNCVLIQRKIKASIEAIRKIKKRDERSILTNGDDVISSVVFNFIKDKINKSDIGIQNIFEEIDQDKFVYKIFELLKEEVSRIGKGIPTIFKNFTDCEDIFNSLIKKVRLEDISK